VEVAGSVVDQVKTRKVLFQTFKKIRAAKTFLVYHLTNGIRGAKKTKKVLFQTFKNIRACQKPSWFITIKKFYFKLSKR
jgi:hypothetical protein